MLAPSNKAVAKGLWVSALPKTNDTDEHQSVVIGLELTNRFVDSALYTNSEASLLFSEGKRRIFNEFSEEVDSILLNKQLAYVAIASGEFLVFRGISVSIEVAG